MLRQMLANIDVFPSDSDEEIIYRMNQIRRRKKFKKRVNYLQELNDEEFLRRFRLNKETFHLLLDQIRGSIVCRTKRNNAVSPESKLLLALRFYATGSMLLATADFIGVSESTACVVIRQVTEAIASLRPRYIYMPQNRDEILNVQLKMYRIARFPKVVGAIDCTLVEIESPGGENAEYYRSRKGWFAWNVQAICDADLCIRDVVARWPGSTHDQTIFNNSSVRAKIEDGQFGDAIILGDAGYAVSPYLIPPLANPTSDEEKLFNECQIRTRNVIERCFGVWKRRFPIISLVMRVSLQRSQAVIVATAVLHNLAIQQREVMPEDDLEIIEHIRRLEQRRHERELHQRLHLGYPMIDGNNARRLTIINEYFRNLL